MRGYVTLLGQVDDRCWVSIGQICMVSIKFGHIYLDKGPGYHQGFYKIPEVIWAYFNTNGHICIDFSKDWRAVLDPSINNQPIAG